MKPLSVYQLIATSNRTCLQACRPKSMYSKNHPEEPVETLRSGSSCRWITLWSFITHDVKVQQTGTISQGFRLEHDNMVFLGLNKDVGGRRIGMLRFD